MKVLYIEVNKGAELVDMENSLEALQKAVGGDIETLTNGDYVLILNEEGALKSLPLNITASQLYGLPLLGNVVICGVDGDEFTDVPERMRKFAV